MQATLLSRLIVTACSNARHTAHNGHPLFGLIMFESRKSLAVDWHEVEGKSNFCKSALISSVAIKTQTRSIVERRNNGVIASN